MRTYFTSLVVILLLFSTKNAFGQIIRGTVYDETTEEPLAGATVYLDGTTLSTMSDRDGNFTLNTNGNNAILVVRFVGYSSLNLNLSLQNENKKLKVLLKKETFSLDEVKVRKGPFSRREMMRVFKQQFLGESEAGSTCKIENEKDIVLYYDVSNNTLNASAVNPLKITNSHLGYEVNFDLKELVVQYEYKSLRKHNMVQSIFVGTTFYRDISDNSKTESRRDAFYESATHFAQTLANNRWIEENMELYVNGFQVNPSNYFKIEDSVGWKKVTLFKEPMREVRKMKKEFDATRQLIYTETDEFEMKPTYFVIRNKKKNSYVVFREKVLFVNSNGNYKPILGLGFGGYMGTLKAGDMLPIDYYNTIKEKQ